MLIDPHALDLPGDPRPQTLPQLLFGVVIARAHAIEDPDR
jgi:hypothetical protein